MRINKTIKHLPRNFFVFAIKTRAPIRLFLIFLTIFMVLLFILFLANAKKIQQLNASAPDPARIGPVYVRGIYISSWTASKKGRINELINFILRTKLNGVVIDIKDSTGKIAYKSKIYQANKWKTSENRIKNISALLKKFKSHGIYTIARIAVFLDPTLAKIRPDLALKNKNTNKLWTDNKGMQWLDPASRQVWAYNVALAKEALNLGFEEVNFDYARFPSGGNISNINYPVWDKKIPRYKIIKQFFQYQSQKLKHIGRRSIDVFGMTMMLANTNDDMNIGQRFIDAIDYFDYISPMLYPSHFGIAFKDFKNPSKHPYKVIYRSFEKIKTYIIKPLLKQNKPLPLIRPWIQAFDLGAYYTPEMVNLEKQAVIQGGGYGWLLWNAKNKYEYLEPLLKK